MSLGTLTILLVTEASKDQPHYATIIQAELPAQVRFAASSEAAIALLASAQPPDMVVVDLDLPQVRSEQILAAIKSNYRLRYTPVVMLTGDGDPRQQLTLLDQGADDFIEKHAPREVLIARLRTQVRRKLAIDRLEKAVLERDLFAAGVLQEVGSIQWSIVSLCRQARAKIQADPSAHHASIHEDLNRLIDYGSKIGRYAEDTIKNVSDSQRQAVLDPQHLYQIIECVMDILASADDSAALRISWELAPELTPVLGDRNDLKLVLLNLAQHILDDDKPDLNHVVHVTQEDAPERVGEQRYIRTLFSVPTRCLPPTAVATLFEPYARCTVDGSLNLSLALVAKVIAKLGGKTSAHLTGDGQGLVYVIELPAA